MEIEGSLAPLLGGAIIGVAAASLLVLTGKTAGVSGALYGALTREKNEFPWQLAFVLGIVAGGLLVRAWMPDAIPERVGDSLPGLAVAGLLVGYGTRLGGGCTSGHGVCGIGRLSRRSIVATLTFMLAGAVTVYVVRHARGA